MKHVYLVRAGESHYKVGIASNILSRVKALQTSNANEIEVITSKQTPDASVIEKRIHKLLHEWKLNGGKEWFKLTPDKALEIAVLINRSPGLGQSDIDSLKIFMEDYVNVAHKISGRIKALLEQIQHEKPTEDKQVKSLAEKVTVPKPDFAARQKQRDEDDEEAIQQALKIIHEEGRASTSLLQRRMLIGYAKAARIIDKLEARGIVGELDGAKPRKLIANISKSMVD